MTDWKNPPRLFIPGPVNVLPEVLEQLARPTLGHRGKEYSQLHSETVDMLRKIIATTQSVFISTSSASGVCGKEVFATAWQLVKRCFVQCAGPSVINTLMLQGHAAEKQTNLRCRGARLSLLR